MKRVVNNIAELIGDTPLVKLNKVADPDGAAVYAKIEYFNPSSSVKDRAAHNMIVEAEKQGKLKAGSTIIEPTSGNTGIGLAMNAAARGYKAIIVMPNNSTQERIKMLKAYGAKVVLTPSEEKMPGAIRKAEELLADTPGGFMPMQFENSANPGAHKKSTALEIIEAMKELGKDPAAFVSTAGTGGTVTGTGEVLKEHYKDLVIHVAEPAGSPVLSGGEPGKHKLVGTSPGFVPEILNLGIVDHIHQIQDGEAYDMTRRLAREEGILVGPSSGASVFTAVQAAKDLSPDQVVICMTFDTGERYLSGDVFEIDEN